MKTTKTLFLVIATIAGLNLVVSIIYAETGYFDFIQKIIPTEKILTWGMFVPFCVLIVAMFVYFDIKHRQKSKEMYM